MKNHRVQDFTVIALQDVEPGDSLIFNYLNSLANPYGYATVIKSVAALGFGGKYCHGTVTEPAKAGEKVNMRVALAGTVAIKTSWVGTIDPGEPVYPGVTFDGVLSATGTPGNEIGMYVGTKALVNNGTPTRIEVLIVRLSSVYVE